MKQEGDGGNRKFLSKGDTKLERVLGIREGQERFVEDMPLKVGNLCGVFDLFSFGSIGSNLIKYPFKDELR